LLLCGDENGDNDGEAREILASLDGKNSVIDSEKFLVYFSDRARYRALKVYTDHLLRVAGGGGLLFYKALYGTALFDADDSTAAMDTMEPGEKEKYKQELAIIGKVNDELKTGRVNYIFDVNGIPMAYYDPARGKTVSLTPGMRFDAFNERVKGSLKFYSLTIDLALQKKIHGLFERKKHWGSFLLFNLNDGSVAAAYSRPRGGKEKTGNAVFSQRYEPGSIVKVLTLFAYLFSGEQDIFPFQCKGSITLNGKVFYDWLKHDTVKGHEEALAVSCNLCFARMGLNMGLKKLSGVFKSFYFNADEGAEGGFRDLFLQFRAGTVNGAVSDDFQLAELSVGLNEVTVTTFHTALLSSVIAQSGSIYSPHLIKNRKNLLNLAYYNHPSRLLAVMDDGAAFLKVKNAMIRVVDDPNGTGKRSKVDFMRVGLKTGTAGSKKQGFDAVLMGFFPAEKPGYAFGFRLERAGKAELQGAYFLKDFLDSFYRGNKR
ncbi:MAG: hypothetical protein GY950_34880, partial [bacterium]|nr:hypothetical protein [bacterium]